MLQHTSSSTPPPPAARMWTQEVVSASIEKTSATRIVIAHRLSTIRNADRIYVLERGRIVQQGSYDELVAQEGLFRELVRRQEV